MKKIFLAAATCLIFAAPALASNCATGSYDFGAGCVKPTPEQGLELLLQGNAKFITGDLDQLIKNAKPADRTEVAAGQKPFAIILTCSDSRVPPEILFNKGLGEIFVVRVAGNIVAPHELGSIEYAIEHLGANLVVVLGHERCGAVTTAFNSTGKSLGPNLDSLVASIAPAVAETKAAGGGVQECIINNVKLVSKSLEEQSEIIKEYVEGKKEANGEITKIKIVGATYDLDDGKVTILGE